MKVVTHPFVDDGFFFTLLVAHSSSAELNGFVVEKKQGLYVVACVIVGQSRYDRSIQVLLHVEECWKIPTLATSY